MKQPSGTWFEFLVNTCTANHSSRIGKNHGCLFVYQMLIFLGRTGTSCSLTILCSTWLYCRLCINRKSRHHVFEIWHHLFWCWIKFGLQHGSRPSFKPSTAVLKNASLITWHATLTRHHECILVGRAKLKISLLRFHPHMSPCLRSEQLLIQSSLLCSTVWSNEGSFGLCVWVQNHQEII